MDNFTDGTSQYVLKTLFSEKKIFLEKNIIICAYIRPEKNLNFGSGSKPKPRFFLGLTNSEFNSIHFDEIIKK